jgi:GNAT superfamily N-acetyltransferase
MHDIDKKEKPLIEYRELTGNEKMDEVRQLCREYADSLDIDLCFQDFEQEMKDLPGKYTPPDGAIILVEVDKQTAGCIALKKIGEGIAEMKRLYIRDAYRGLGISKTLIEMIICKARQIGYSYLRLDTLSTMQRALKVYESFGFYEIGAYVYNPCESVHYMELKLKQ